MKYYVRVTMTNGKSYDSYRFAEVTAANRLSTEIINREGDGPDGAWVNLTDDVDVRIDHVSTVEVKRVSDIAGA